MVQAGVYSGLIHYFKTLDAMGGNPHDGVKVVAKMKEAPTDDPLFGKGTIRADGRKIHPAYLFEVKKPAESKGPWDYYKLIGTTPARPGLPAAFGKRLSAGKEVTTIARRRPCRRASSRVPTRFRVINEIECETDASSLRPAFGGIDQRIVLRAAQSRARRDLRHAQHHQFRPWRALHDGRVLRVFPAEPDRHRLLVGAADRADRGRHLRHDPGADHAAMAGRPRPSLWPAADLRHRADRAGRVPELFRLVRAALCDSRLPADRRCAACRAA